jgi:catechol 2,3-dioxygenase-like lactoylglutathione lyase family enzyme
VVAIRAKVDGHILLAAVPAAGTHRRSDPMFKPNGWFSTYAVKDTEKARAFYGDTLGLDVRDGREAGLLELHLGDGGPVILYPKPDHVPATFTVLNFVVSDVSAAVDELSAVGIPTLRYPGVEQDAKGIVRGQGPTIAWFADPDGNIISVLENSMA